MPVAMNSSVLEDFQKPAQLTGKASSMIHRTLFYIAIEQFAGLNLVYGKNLLRTATMPSRSNQITPRLFFAELSQMGRCICIPPSHRVCVHVYAFVFVFCFFSSALFLNFDCFYINCWHFFVGYCSLDDGQRQ